VVGHNVCAFLRRARSGRGCSARASASDRAGPQFRADWPRYAFSWDHRHKIDAGCRRPWRRCRKAKVVRDDLFLRQRSVSPELRKPLRAGSGKGPRGRRGRWHARLHPDGCSSIGADDQWGRSSRRASPWSSRLTRGMLCSLALEREVAQAVIKRRIMRNFESRRPQSVKAGREHMLEPAQSAAPCEDHQSGRAARR
jgi:hypothetical protein